MVGGLTAGQFAIYGDIKKLLGKRLLLLLLLLRLLHLTLI